MRSMAPTPRPDGWQGGSEDFAFLRTLDGHEATDRFATPGECESGRNARKGFEQADLSGDYFAEDA